MNNDIQNFSSRERGLLSVASQHKGTVGFYENTVVPHLEATLVKAWKNTLALPVEDIWEYIQEAKWNTYVKIDSAKIGVLTTIADYTNKKHETKPAHFTQNGSYIGSIKQLGDKPVSYMGNFRITKEHFEVYEPANPKRATDFFRPKEIAVCCSEEPLPVPKRKKPVLIDDDNDEVVCSIHCHSGACIGVCQVEVEGVEAYLTRTHREYVLRGDMPKCEKAEKCTVCDGMRKEEAPKKKRPTVAKKPVVGDE